MARSSLLVHRPGGAQQRVVALHFPKELAGRVLNGRRLECQAKSIYVDERSHQVAANDLSAPPPRAAPHFPPRAFLAFLRVERHAIALAKVVKVGGSAAMQPLVHELTTNDRTLCGKYLGTMQL